jgi:hypothetical protein
MYSKLLKNIELNIDCIQKTILEKDSLDNFKKIVKHLNELSKRCNYLPNILSSHRDFMRDSITLDKIKETCKDYKSTSKYLKMIKEIIDDQ